MSSCFDLHPLVNFGNFSQDLATSNDNPLVAHSLIAKGYSSPPVLPVNFHHQGLLQCLSSWSEHSKHTVIPHLAYSHKDSLWQCQTVRLGHPSRTEHTIRLALCIG